MLTILLSQVKQYKKASILTPSFMLLEVVVEMMIPRLMARIVDVGIDQGNLQAILINGLGMVALAGVGLFAGFMGGKYGAYASTGFARNLREAMFRKIQTFSFHNIDRFSTASLITRLTTDVTNVQNAYQMILRMGMRSPASLIVAMTMAFTISPRLALIYVGVVILLGIGLFAVAFSVHGIFEKIFREYDNMNESVQENVTGIRVVKAYVREAYEKSRFAKTSQGLMKKFVHAESILALNGPMMMISAYGSMLLISWFGAHMIIQNELSTGDLMSLMTYSMNILMSLMMLSMAFVMITLSRASMNRIAEVLQEEPSITNPADPVTEVADGSIRFDHVSFSYGGQNDKKISAEEAASKNGSSAMTTSSADDHTNTPEQVLTDINLDIKSGETIGIIGSTGSSKTSLVNLISRLYDVTEGSLYVGGRDVRDYDLVTLRNEVSVVLQKNVLFSGTIYANLRWGDPNATDEECRRACRLACADEFIERLPDGYNTHMEQGGTNVSGGQKQRLCIARALLKKPKILILDDSTSAVDTATDARIRRAFREEIPHTTRLIIAQRISSVQDADRIVVMDNGRINGIGTHEELLANNAIYRDVYESQTGGTGDFDEEKALLREQAARQKGGA